MKKALVVCTAALLPVFLWSGTAHANVTGSVYHGSDYSYSDGFWESPRDQEADGNGVYANLYSDGVLHGFLWDGNGSTAGGNSYYFPGGIDGHRVCEDRKSPCSSWVWG